MTLFFIKVLKRQMVSLKLKLKPEKNHVSVKLAIAKTGTSEQMQLQMQVVNLIKEAGAESVGIRFTELSPEELDKHRVSIPKKKILVYFRQIVRRNLLPLRAVRAAWVNQQFLSTLRQR